MIKKHLFRISLFVLLAVAAFAGCKKDPLGSVSGTLTVYDPSTPLVKTPVDSIKVYLINMDFKQDTVNPENNRAALIDSTYTDAAGKYTFTDIQKGNYAVAPNFTIKHYWFLPDNPGQDASFSITADIQNHEINFTAPIPNSGNDGANFHMTINSVNRPASGYIVVKRQDWCFFVPVYYVAERIEGDNGLYKDEYANLLAPGVSNAWFLEAWELKDSKGKKQHSYWLRWELWNMPDKLTVTIDWATQKMTVVEGQ